MKKSAPRLVLVRDSGFTEEDNDGDDTKIVTIARVSGFSRCKLEADRNELGLCTADMSLKVVVSVF